MERCVNFDVRFQHPSTYMTVGPSQCSKSHFVVKLLKNVDSMIDEPPERIVWCYSKLQRKLFDEFADRVEFMEGLPNSDLLDGRRTLLIIDDLMSERCCSKIRAIQLKSFIWAGKFIPTTQSISKNRLPMQRLDHTATC